MTISANQAAFNGAWRGLKSQGFERSVDPEQTCLYRGDEGRCCAAGWLISDKHYKARFEGLPADDWIVFPAVSRTFEDAGLGAPDPEILLALQGAHDRSCSPEDMRRHLEDVAQRHGLEIPSE